MEDLQLQPSERPERVYIIVRVFNLTSEHIGMRILVDPWRLKGDALKFFYQGQLC
jgi:hypothetical protein